MPPCWWLACFSASAASLCPPPGTTHPRWLTRASWWLQVSPARIEFIADKIPWVDSAWDSIHTVIRPIGAVLLASSLFSNLDPAYQVLLFLLAGGIAFTGHSAKATLRLAVNHSPEPFSNIGLSLAEDASVAGGLYLLARHPWVLAGIALAFLALSAWLGPRIYRALTRGVGGDRGPAAPLAREGSGTATHTDSASVARRTVSRTRAFPAAARDRHGGRAGSAQRARHALPQGARSVFRTQVGAARDAPNRSARCRRDERRAVAGSTHSGRRRWHAVALRPARRPVEGRTGRTGGLLTQSVDSGS